MPNEKLEDEAVSEQEAAFERAREILEKVGPILDETNPNDEFTALQIRIARLAVKLNRTPKEVLAVLAVNVPQFMVMVKQAYADVEAEENGKLITS